MFKQLLWRRPTWGEAIIAAAAATMLFGLLKAGGSTFWVALAAAAAFCSGVFVVVWIGSPIPRIASRYPWTRWLFWYPMVGAILFWTIPLPSILEHPAVVESEEWLAISFVILSFVYFVGSTLQARTTGHKFWSLAAGIFAIGFTVVLFSHAYRYAVPHGLGKGALDPTPCTYWGDLYFSSVTFTTLGYGDIKPVGVARLFATVEAFLGYGMLPFWIALLFKAWDMPGTSRRILAPPSGHVPPSRGWMVRLKTLLKCRSSPPPPRRGTPQLDASRVNVRGVDRVTRPVSRSS